MCREADNVRRILHWVARFLWRSDAVWTVYPPQENTFFSQIAKSYDWFCRLFSTGIAAFCAKSDVILQYFATKILTRWIIPGQIATTDRYPLFFRILPAPLCLCPGCLLTVLFLPTLTCLTLSIFLVSRRSERSERSWDSERVRSFSPPNPRLLSLVPVCRLEEEGGGGRGFT